MAAMNRTVPITDPTAKRSCRVTWSRNTSAAVAMRLEIREIIPSACSSTNSWEQIVKRCNQRIFKNLPSWLRDLAEVVMPPLILLKLFANVLCWYSNDLCQVQKVEPASCNSDDVHLGAKRLQHETEVLGVMLHLTKLNYCSFGKNI